MNIKIKITKLRTLFMKKTTRFFKNAFMQKHQRLFQCEECKVYHSTTDGLATDGLADDIDRKTSKRVKEGLNHLLFVSSIFPSCPNQ